MGPKTVRFINCMNLNLENLEIIYVMYHSGTVSANTWVFTNDQKGDL